GFETAAAAGVRDDDVGLQAVDESVVARLALAIVRGAELVVIGAGVHLAHGRGLAHGAAESIRPLRRSLRFSRPSTPGRTARGRGVARLRPCGPADRDRRG